MKLWQTVITAAGEDNASFQRGGIDLPKNLIPFGDSTILGTSISSYSLHDDKTHVMIRSDEAEKWKTDKILSTAISGVQFHRIPRATRGALCSAAMALDFLESDLPLVITSGDSFIGGDLLKLIPLFFSKGASAGTLLFQDSLPRWSFARLGRDDKILEMAEKSPISTYASTGLFYFRSAELFMRAAEWVLKENMHTNGEFYLSSALNYLIMNGEKVLGVELSSGYNYVPLSTFSDLQRALKEKNASI